MSIGFRRPRAPQPTVRIGTMALAASLLVGISGPAVAEARALAPASAAAAPDRAAASAFAGSPVGDRAATALVDDAAATIEQGLPSIQYEEAEAHRLDQIPFAPGGRVTVGFTPRAGDTATVGDQPAAPLPAGRLDGATMRREGVIERPTPSAQTPVVDVAAASVDLRPDLAAAAGPSAAAGAPTLAAVAPTPQAAVAAGGLRREVFGFLPYWQVNSSSLRIDYARISTIAYFGVGVDGSGNLKKRTASGSTSTGWSGWTSARMTSLISTAHKNHTRVVLTVQAFGWTTSSMATQRALLASPGARAKLAGQIAAAVRNRGADGVNLDFEPLAKGYERHFVALLRSIRTALNRYHTGYQITFDTTASIANYPVYAATSKGAADAVFIMGYDFRSSGSAATGSIAPYRRDGYDINDTLATYLHRVSARKLILGVPYYGRAWSTATKSAHSRNTSSTRSGASVSVTYDTAASYLAAKGRHYDTQEQVAWTVYKRENCTSTYGCYVSWRQLYVDDAQAIRAKYDLVNRLGLRGAGIWALGYDGTRRELWNAIAAKFGR